jgi:hypothetical protein
VTILSAGVLSFFPRNVSAALVFCLKAKGIPDLVAGNNKIPLAELIEFRESRYYPFHSRLNRYKKEPIF